MKVTKNDITGTWFDHPEMTIPAGTRVTDRCAGKKGEDNRLAEGHYFIDDLSWVKPWEDGTRKSGFLHDATHYGIRITEDQVESVVSSYELFQQQCPSFNFEKNESQLLEHALKVGFVTPVEGKDDQYLINDNYGCNK